MPTVDAAVLLGLDVVAAVSRGNWVGSMLNRDTLDCEESLGVALIPVSTGELKRAPLVDVVEAPDAGVAGGL